MNRSIFKLGVTVTIGLGFAITLLWLSSSWSPVVHATGPVLYVAPGGSDTTDCTNIANPCATIQYAVDRANTGAEIRVRAGAYVGVSARESFTQTVYLSKTVTIRGGYSSTFADPPNPNTNLTLLDAQGNGRVFYVIGNISPTIEGLHMVAGNATGLGGAFFNDDAGGDIYIITATVTLSGNHIASGTASYGGGLFASKGVVALIGSTIASNSVAFDGGGLYLESSSVTLDGSSVISNIASNNGGGVYLLESTGTLTANNIVSNTASRNGGGLYLSGSPVTVTNNTVRFNAACCTMDLNQGGGGIYLNSSAATLRTNIVVSNTASTYGGGLRLQDSNAIIRRNTILSNSASLGGGGGLILFQGNPTVDGNTIVANSGRDGGGIYIAFNGSSLTNNIVAENRATRYGSGIYIVVASPKFLHMTIARNTGGDGAGIHVAVATASFTNTMLVSHTQGIRVGIESTATLQATLWGSGVWANGLDWGGAGAVITGTVNVNGDPMFVGPATQDYHIGVGSAARDTGVNAGVNTDLDSDPRPFGTGYDIGADEFISSISYYIYLPAVLKQGP